MENGNQIQSAVQAIAKAEELINKCELAEESYQRPSNELIESMKESYRELKSHLGLEVSEKFADKYHYVTRYLQDAVFIYTGIML